MCSLTMCVCCGSRLGSKYVLMYGRHIRIIVYLQQFCVRTCYSCCNNVCNSEAISPIYNNKIWPLSRLPCHLNFQGNFVRIRLTTAEMGIAVMLILRALNKEAFRSPASARMPITLIAYYGNRGSRRTADRKAEKLYIHIGHHT